MGFNSAFKGLSKEKLCNLHDHPFYLLCPDVLSLGDECGSSTDKILVTFFFYVLIFLFMRGGIQKVTGNSMWRAN